MTFTIPLNGPDIIVGATTGALAATIAMWSRSEARRGVDPNPDAVRPADFGWFAAIVFVSAAAVAFLAPCTR